MLPLARILGLARAHRGPDLPAGAFADRSEPPFAARGGDHERRRLRDRLVTASVRRPASFTASSPPGTTATSATSRRTSSRRSCSRTSAPRRALPSSRRTATVPVRALAVDAQRGDARLPRGQARPHARRRPVAVPVDRGLHRLGGVLLPRAHARPRGRPARRRRGGRQVDRRDRPASRGRAPDPDDRRHERRLERVGVPDEVFSHARSHGRAVVTENVRDFRPLVVALLVAGDNHAGVVFTTEKQWPRGDPGVLVAALEQLGIDARSADGRRALVVNDMLRVEFPDHLLVPESGWLSGFSARQDAHQIVLASPDDKPPASGGLCDSLSGGLFVFSGVNRFGLVVAKWSRSSRKRRRDYRCTRLAAA